MPAAGHVSLLLLLFSAIAATTTALTHPSDLLALKAFKAAIAPHSIPSWSCLATWDFAAGDPCSLPRRTHFLCGLSCNPSATRITSLTLDSAAYSGTLSPLLSRLSLLTTLDLSDNSFSGAIPATLSSLASLQTLVLAGNSFSGHIPTTLSSLSSLQTLDLSRNFLSGDIPATFSSLTSLQSLDLSSNKLTGKIPNLPPNLIQLVIRSNSLSGSLPQPAFSKSGRLQVIDFAGNSLAGVLPAWFFTLLPSLQQLNLSNNTLTHLEIPAPHRAAGNSLIAVDIGFNRISGEVPVNFALYPSLSALSLRHNRLHGEIPWQYSRKASLTRLFLDGNFLTGKPAPEFFSEKGNVAAGSFGDNCLRGCPRRSELCLPSQKPTAVCRRVYRGKPRS